jgi:hypothetical protein
MSGGFAGLSHPAPHNFRWHGSQRRGSTRSGPLFIVFDGWADTTDLDTVAFSA